MSLPLPLSPTSLHKRSKRSKQKLSPSTKTQNETKRWKSISISQDRPSEAAVTNETHRAAAWHVCSLCLLCVQCGVWGVSAHLNQPADQADGASGHTPMASVVRQRLDGCISSAKESPMGTSELRTTGKLNFIRSLDGRGLEQLLTA